MRLLAGLLLVVSAGLIAPVSFPLCAACLAGAFYVGNRITAASEHAFMSGLFLLAVIGVIAQIVVG